MAWPHAATMRAHINTGHELHQSVQSGQSAPPSHRTLKQVTRVAFDGQHEVVWAGTSAGRVLTFSAPHLTPLAYASPLASPTTALLPLPASDLALVRPTPYVIPSYTRLGPYVSVCARELLVHLLLLPCAVFPQLWLGTVSAPPAAQQNTKHGPGGKGPVKKLNTCTQTHADTVHFGTLARRLLGRRVQCC